MREVLQEQRTYALIGHGGAGKTSVAEMLLFRTGVAGRLGKIDEGTTLLDYEPEEIKRRGSVQPAFAQYVYRKNNHFLVDAPGDNNFIGDLPYLLAAVDGVVLVIDAVDGVTPLTRRIWKEVKKAGLPAMVFVNKMDRERADFSMALAGLTDSLGIKPALLTLPIGAEDAFAGLVDVIAEKAVTYAADGSASPADIPSDLADELSTLRETMVENVAESDEELMEKYLEEGELDLEDLTRGLRLGVLSGELVPVCAGSALRNTGGEELLQAVQSYMPSPLDRAPYRDSKGGEHGADPDAPTACLVFKTIVDPFAGQLSVLRVVSGVLSSDQSLYNPRTDNKEKVGQVLFLQGKKQVPCKTPVGPGAIVALAKLKSTHTGDMLCKDEADAFTPDLPKLPSPLLTYALAAANKGEEDKVFAAVNKLLDEDISLHLERNEETGDMLLSGMGQLHIETSVEKARRRSKVDIVLQTPKVPYRETIKGRAEVQGRYKKQTGGRGQFGDCWIKLESQPSGAGYEFVDAIVGGVIPRQYIPAVDKGIQEASARGVRAGFPVIDFKATLYDGSYHTVDSSEMAFKVAGSMAFKKAAEQAGVTLLEPIMLMSIFVPDEFMGDVIGDISSRRGRVLGSDSDSGLTEVRVHVPMAEVLKYAPTLNSMTGGQGTFTMEFDHYEECPPQVADKVVADNARE